MSRNIIIIISLMLLMTIACLAQNLEQSQTQTISKSISINDAISIALINSPTITSRKAMVKQASARIGMAKSMSKLQISTSTFLTSSNMPMIIAGAIDVQPQNYSITADKGRLNQNFMAMFPIYTGGKLKNSISSSQALLESSNYEVLASELDVALAIKETYLKALLAKHYLDSLQKKIDEASERVRIAEISFANGRIAKYDLLRNQTDLAEAQQNKNNAQLDFDLALIELKTMMSISQSSNIALSENMEFNPKLDSLESLLEIALKQRPEIAVESAKIRSAISNLKAAKASYKPQIYGTAMADFSLMNDNEFEKGYLIGISASIPILDGGLRKASVDESQAMLIQLQENEKEAILNVNKDVASAYAQLQSAAKNIVLSQSAVTQAEEDYRVIKMRYEAGKAINVEVLDALASLTRSRTNYSDSLYTYNIAKALLSRAIGQR